jgi:hypothetical protein
MNAKKGCATVSGTVFAQRGLRRAAVCSGVARGVNSPRGCRQGMLISSSIHNQGLLMMTRHLALKTSLTVALAISAVCGGPLPVVHAATIYVSLNGSATKFGSFSTTSGSFSAIATPGLGALDNLQGLTWDESLGVFRAIVMNLGDEFLTTVSTSGSVGSVGSRVGLTNPGDGYLGLATTGSANPLYTFVNAGGSFSYALGTTNRGTGAWSTVSGVYSGFAIEGFPPAYGIMSFYGDTLYAAGKTSDANVFGTLNTTTGLFSQIGSANNVFQSMALTSDGTTLYGVSVSQNSPGIYSINPSTGVPTLLTAAIGFPAETYVVGAGMAASPVPEPAAYAMALMGLACSGYATWRRLRGRRRLAHAD